MSMRAGPRGRTSARAPLRQRRNRCPGVLSCSNESLNGCAGPRLSRSRRFGQFSYSDHVDPDDSGSSVWKLCPDGRGLSDEEFWRNAQPSNESEDTIRLCVGGGCETSDSRSCHANLSRDVCTAEVALSANQLDGPTEFAQIKLPLLEPHRAESRRPQASWPSPTHLSVSRPSLQKCPRAITTAISRLRFGPQPLSSWLRRVQPDSACAKLHDGPACHMQRLLTTSEMPGAW